MSKNPYDHFPHIVTKEIALRKIVPSDADALFEIYSNEKLFIYAPVTIKKNKNTVANMIGHFERDFNKKKMITLGVVLNSNPDYVVGVAEMFSYNSKINMITIGYRINERFWGKGLATKTVAAMADYLLNDVGINRIQGFVMPENEVSQKVLLKNNFVKEGIIRQGDFWKGKGVLDLVLFSKLRADCES